MIKSSLFSKTSLLTLVSLFTFSASSFADIDTREMEIGAVPFTLNHTQKSIEESADFPPLADLISNEKEQLEPTDPLAKIRQKKTEEINIFHKTAKIAIITGAVAVGAGLAWFYGPALAYTAAYKTTVALASIATPTAGWWTKTFVIEPAAIDAGIFFANSAVVHSAIGALSSSGGYVLGKVGCATYDTVNSGLGWIGSKLWG